jgi:hypothetical protein
VGSTTMQEIFKTINQRAVGSTMMQATVKAIQTAQSGINMQYARPRPRNASRLQQAPS